MAISAFVWMGFNRSALTHFDAILPDLLTVGSILFGFVTTSLVFYIQAASEWSQAPKVMKVAGKLIDWHVFTILCLILFILAVICVRLLPIPFTSEPISCTLKTTELAPFTFLAFLGSYIAGQLVNHVLTVRWIFHNSAQLRKTVNDESS